MADKKRQNGLLGRWKKNRYSRPVVAWEASVGYDAVRNFTDNRGTSESVLDEMLRVMDIHDADAKKVATAPLETLLIEPIRTLHLGKKAEEALIEAEITHVFALVKLTPFEVAKLTPLGVNAATNLAKKFGPSLRFGMNVKDYKRIKAVFTVEVVGSYPDVAAAISSLNRHLYAQVDRDDIKVHGVVDVEEDQLKPKGRSGAPNGSKGNYPFQFKMAAQCRDSKLEIRHRRYRSCKELVAKVREFADRLEGVVTVKDWLKSDAWSIDL